MSSFTAVNILSPGDTNIDFCTEMERQLKGTFCIYDHRHSMCIWMQREIAVPYHYVVEFIQFGSAYSNNTTWAAQYTYIKKYILLKITSNVENLN